MVSTGFTRFAVRVPPSYNDSIISTSSTARFVAQKRTLAQKQYVPSSLRTKHRWEQQQRQKKHQQQRDHARHNELRRQQDRPQDQPQMALTTVQPEQQRLRRNKKDPRASTFEHRPSTTKFSTLPRQSPHLLETKTRIGSYHIGKLLGEGGYGKVYEATRVIEDGRPDTTRQETFALKKIDKRRLSTRSMLDDLTREIHIMQRIRHPNVVRCHQVMHGRDHIHIVLDKAAIDLYDYKRKHGLIREDDIKVVMKGVLCGLNYLHSKGISHLDIKAENVLLLRVVRPHELKATDVQLCDFGLAVRQKDPKEFVHGCRGTFGFMAPELVTTEKGHGRSADMWSFGVTVLELMLEGLPSRWPTDPKAHIHEYTDRIMDCLEVLYSLANKPRWNLIRRLLKFVPHNRLTAREALEHDWFQEDNADYRDDAPSTRQNSEKGENGIDSQSRM